MSLLLLLLLSCALFAVGPSAADPSAAAVPDDECVLDLAIVCLDDKLLVYVNWLEKRDKLNVVGDIVTIVKKHGGRAEDRSKLQQHHGSDSAAVRTSLGPAIDEYFDTHTLRISLPWILDDDIDLELDQQGKRESARERQRWGGAQNPDSTTFLGLTGDNGNETNRHFLFCSSNNFRVV